MRAIQAMIAQEGFFDLLHLQRVLALQELTVSSLVPLTRQIAASVFRLGEHGQAFKNRLLIVPLAVKESAARRGWDFLAGRAWLQPLETSWHIWRISFGTRLRYLMLWTKRGLIPTSTGPLSQPFFTG